MERATDFEYVRQLPRRTVPEIDKQDETYDRQVLLNESWLHYCHRVGKPASQIGREEDHQKWVTETWEDYEARVVQRAAYLQQFDHEQDRLKAEHHASTEQRQRYGTAVVNALMKQDAQRQQSSNLPQLHSLLLDFEDLRLERERKERLAVEEEEAAARKARSDEEERERRELRIFFNDELRRITEMLERLVRERAEAEQRRLDEIRRRDEEARLAEEARQREKEEAEKRRKEQIEEEKRAERRRKDEERRAKARAEKEAKRGGGGAGAATTAASPTNAMDNSDVSQSQSTGPTVSSLREVSRANRARRMEEQLDAFLSRLKGRAASVESSEDLDELFRGCTNELGGGESPILFHTCVYIGVKAEDPHTTAPVLKYQYASPNCSPRLLRGAAVLDGAAHPNAPSFTRCVQRLSGTGVLDASDTTLVQVGDNAAGIGPAGKFLAVPIAAAIPPSGDIAAVAVLAMDTFSSNPNDAAGSFAADEGNCYAVDTQNGEAATAAVDISERVAQFAQDVASVLGNAHSRFLEKNQSTLGQSTGGVALPAIPPNGFATVNHLYAWLTAQLRGCLGPDGPNSPLDCYVSQLHQPDGKEATIVAHNGFTVHDPQRDPSVPTHLLGATLQDPRAATFSAMGREPGSCFAVNDVSTDDRCVLYQQQQQQAAASKASEALLLVPLVNIDNKVSAVLGITAPAGAFTDEIINALQAFVWGQIRPILLPLQAQEEVRTVCDQALEWVTMTTGCTNAYIALTGGEGNQTLQIVAASQGQKWLEGKTWLRGDGGVSHGFLDQVNPSDQDTTVVHHPNVFAVPDVHFWNDAVQSGRPGSAEGSQQPALMMAALTRGVVPVDGGQPVVHAPRGILYADTVNGQNQKKAFTKGDMEMLRVTGALLADALDEIATRRVAPSTNPMVLSIEQLIGPEKIRFLRKVWEKVTADIQNITKDQLLELSRYNSPPAIIPLTVAATLIVMGAKPKAVEQWEDARKKINQALLGKIAKFDPTSTKKKKAFFTRARKMTKPYTADDIFVKGSYPASCFFTWTFVTLLLRKVSDLLRKRVKEGKLTSLGGGADAATDASTSVGTDDLDRDDDLGDEGDGGEGEEEGGGADEEA